MDYFMGSQRDATKQLSVTGHKTVQYSGLENSMDCISHGVEKSQTRLSDFHFLFWGFPAGSDSKESGAVGNT